MTILSLEEFVAVVAKMRKAQKNYFKTRTVEDLQTARKHEIICDNLIEKMMTQHEQSSFFQEGGPF